MWRVGFRGSWRLEFTMSRVDFCITAADSRQRDGPSFAKPKTRRALEKAPNHRLQLRRRASVEHDFTSVVNVPDRKKFLRNLWRFWLSELRQNGSVKVSLLSRRAGKRPNFTPPRKKFQ